MADLRNFPSALVGDGWIPIKFISRSEEQKIEVYYAAHKDMLKYDSPFPSMDPYVRMIKTALPGAEVEKFQHEFDLTKAFNNHGPMRDSLVNNFAGIRGGELDCNKSIYIVYDNVYPAITLADLFEALGQSPMSETLIVRIVSDLANILDVIHSGREGKKFMGVARKNGGIGGAHGDLQPNNILLNIDMDGQGYPRVILLNLGTAIKFGAEPIEQERLVFIELILKCLTYGRDCFKSGEKHQDTLRCSHREGIVALWDRLLKEKEEKNLTTMEGWLDVAEKLSSQTLREKEDNRSLHDLISDSMVKRGLRITSQEWQAAVKRARGQSPSKINSSLPHPGL